MSIHNFCLAKPRMVLVPELARGAEGLRKFFLRIGEFEKPGCKVEGDYKVTSIIATIIYFEDVLKELNGQFEFVSATPSIDGQGKLNDDLLSEKIQRQLYTIGSLDAVHPHHACLVDGYAKVDRVCIEDIQFVIFLARIDRTPKGSYLGPDNRLFIWIQPVHG